LALFQLYFTKEGLVKFTPLFFVLVLAL
jgi:hypothetical protein